MAGAPKGTQVTDVDTCMSQETPTETVSPRKKLKSSPVVSQKPQTVDSLNELIHDKKPPYNPPVSKPDSSRDFKQQPLSNFFVLEVFAGSARLTKTAKDVGLKALLRLTTRPSDHVGSNSANST